MMLNERAREEREITHILVAKKTNKQTKRRKKTEEKIS
jgi:hypothetical protein